MFKSPSKGMLGRAEQFLACDVPTQTEVASRREVN